MSNFRPVKVIRIGSGNGVLIPAAVCRDLLIHRGDYLNFWVASGDMFFCRKIEVVNKDDIGEHRNPAYPIIQNDE